ncbi:MAG TPA: hypothetical protein VMT72_02160 [Pseudolabrys sp.]|nr:hypothetical protein [Pseudolabrys sp.]
MSRLSSWKEFTPSFTFCGVGQLRELVEATYKHASGALEAEIQTSADPKVRIEGAFDANASGAAGPDRWLNFGHKPQNGTLCSNSLPYRLSAEFDANDELANVSLKIFLANPHFTVSLSDFLPAKFVEQDTKVELLSNVGGRMGFALLSGLGDSAEQPEIYRKLADGLPQASFTAPAGFLNHDQSTLLGRVDLAYAWLRPTEKYLGTWIGVPVENPLGAAGNILRLNLFSSQTTSKVDAFVHDSRKFVLRLSKGSLGTPTFVLEAPKKPKAGDAPAEAAWKLYRAACQEFGLNDGFKGFLFKGLEGSWLEDDLTVSAGTLSAALDVAALSFGDAKIKDGKDVIGFYIGMSLSIRNHPQSTNPQRTFLGWFAAPATLRISYGSNGLRYLTLQGTFAQLETPFQWLSDREFSVSVISHRQGWAAELGLEKTDDKFLARIPVAGNKLLSSAVIALSFAPIIFMSRTPPKTGGAATDVQSRGYFVTVSSNQSIALVFAAASLGYFLEDRVTVEELRITAAHLRTQPARINDPNAGDQRETALLLDYDVDYTVDLHEAGLSTKRAVSSHVDGTGFVLRDNSARWVQVPNGAYELGLSDPGLWDLGLLGKILKIADISIRKEENVSLVLQLRLARNFNGINCDDFLISIDLHSGAVHFESFPAQVQVEIGKVFKGRGLLRIGRDKNGESDVTGAIDLAFLSLKWRVYGALRVTHVKDDANERHLALVATLEVEWPTKIPLLNTGLGLSGLQLVYATHFMRNEKPKVGAIPPALAWLKAAGGHVPSSVEKQSLWVAKYGHWTIGVGVEAGLMVSDTININALLAFEQPGPRIIVFVKVTLLQSKTPNKDNKELTGGILGILEINWEERTITVAVLADLNFGKLLDMQVPMEFGASMIHLSRWHAYLGHFKSPITIDLKIFSQLKAGASGYLMFDGYEIVGLPRADGGVKTLPGFAIAFSLKAGVKIGFDSLYLEVTFATFVDLSLSRVLYAEGTAILSGTLHLWRFDVGASGRWDFYFLRGPDGGTQYRLEGRICGHIKIWRWKIEGCVGLSIGSQITDTAQLDELVQDVFLISGAQAILHGHGAFNAIDAIVGKATIGATPTGEATFDLDSIVVLGMNVPPEVDTTGTGFAPKLPQPTPDASYQLGTKKAKYTIDGVTLQARQADGSLTDVSYADSPARWWRNVARQEGGNPSPISLALLTRNPLAFENAVISPEDPGGALDQLLDGICAPAIAEQYALYFAYPPIQYALEHGACQIRGVLGDLDLELNPGYRAVTDLTVEVVNLRPADISVSVHVLDELIEEAQVPGIALHQFNNGPTDGLINPLLKLSTEGFWRGHLLQICLAVPRGFGASRVAGMVRLRKNSIVIPIDRSNLIVNPLRVDLDAFHERKARWTGACLAFSKLNQVPRYAAHELMLLTIDLKGLSLSEDPTDLLIELDRDLPGQQPRTIVIGPVKVTPSAEHKRFMWDTERKQTLQEEIDDYLSGDTKPKPLLEPDTEYVLSVNYSETIGTINKQHDPIIRSFKSSPLPPRKLDPYLLATYPAGRAARTMPVADAPALLLASHDILRILEKYAVNLKVTITHSGGAPVSDSTSALDWSKGQVFSPADLREPNPPKGIISASHRGWPSATTAAILKLIEEGRLPCINANSFDRALWIGFDVSLHSLSGYHVRLDLVDGNGDPIFLDDPATGASAQFYSFSFTTGLYSTMSDLADRSANGRQSQRVIIEKPDFGPGRIDPQFSNLKIVPDKLLEDAIAKVSGERQVYSGEPDYSILWKKHAQDLQPVAIWIRANEPLLVSSILPRIGEVNGIDGTSTSGLLGEEGAPVWGPKQEPNRTLPVGVSEFAIAESGLSAVLLLDNAAGSADIEMKLKRIWSWQEEDKVSEERTFLRIPASKLKTRTAHFPTPAIGRA